MCGKTVFEENHVFFTLINGSCHGLKVNINVNIVYYLKLTYAIVFLIAVILLAKIFEDMNFENIGKICLCYNCCIF